MSIVSKIDEWDGELLSTGKKISQQNKNTADQTQSKDVKEPDPRKNNDKYFCDI